MNALEKNMRFLMDHLLTEYTVGPWDLVWGESWHHELVSRLRACGFEDFADNFELFRPTDAEREYAHEPMSKHVPWGPEHDSFVAVHSTYAQMCDQVCELIVEHVPHMRYE
jgi:hypothetical protein